MRMPKQAKSNTPKRGIGLTRPSPIKLKPSRQPSHCNQCEGRPLRSQCSHTKSGRRYLQLGETLNEDEQAIHMPVVEPFQDANNEPGEASSEREAPYCTECVGRPLRAQCCHTKAGEIYLREQEILDDLNAHPQHLATHIHSSSHLSNLIIDPTLLNLPHLSGNGSNSTTHTGLLPQNSLDEGSPSDQCVPGERTPPNEDAISPNDTSGAHNSEERNTRGGKAKRPRARASNALYGYVNEVFRGTKAHQIHRTRALSERIDDREKCHKYFLETMNSIVAKCEDLSARTGCWLFIGAQHATARGDPIHFASPRLRRDAGAAIDSFAGEFCTLMNQLMDARRRDTLELQRNLEAIEQQKADLEKQLAVLNSQNIDRDVLLRQYEERYGRVA